jgi:hypothetical protein
MSWGEVADGDADAAADREAGAVASGGAWGRWTGGARMLSGFPWEPARVLWAELEIAPGRIDLRVRSRAMQVIRQIDEISVAPGDGVVISPGRQTAPERFQRERYGIAIWVPGAEARHWRLRHVHRKSRSSFTFKWPNYYFWTDEREQVLATAAAAGFDVSAQEHTIEPPEPDDGG